VCFDEWSRGMEDVWTGNPPSWTSQWQSSTGFCSVAVQELQTELPD
jgi:hypothetical protein